MADTPRTWAILQALQLRLQGITVAGGYRTDAGADVRLEPSDLGDVPSITLFSGATTRPDDARTAGEREFTLIVEAQVPAGLDDAHALTVLPGRMTFCAQRVIKLPPSARRREGCGC